MLPDRVSNPGPLTYESGALPIALRGPARVMDIVLCFLVICSNENTISNYMFASLAGVALYK